MSACESNDASRRLVGSAWARFDPGRVLRESGDRLVEQPFELRVVIPQCVGRSPDLPRSVPGRRAGRSSLIRTIFAIGLPALAMMTSPPFCTSSDKLER